jgi:hypothetical protein
MMIPTAIKTLDFTQIICVGQEEEDMEDDDSNSNQNNLLDCLVQAQSFAFRQVL